MHETNAATILIFLILLWFWGSRGLPEAARKTYRKMLHFGTPTTSVLGPYFRGFWFPNLIFLAVICVNFYVYFWHCFWEASASFFDDLGLIAGCFLESFWTLFRRCCKPQEMQPFQAKCLVWEVLGLRFCIIFVDFLNVFFMSLSRRHFCLILADLGF